MGGKQQKMLKIVVNGWILLEMEGIDSTWLDFFGNKQIWIEKGQKWLEIPGKGSKVLKISE